MRERIRFAIAIGTTVSLLLSGCSGTANNETEATQSAGESTAEVKEESQEEKESSEVKEESEKDSSSEDGSENQTEEGATEDSDDVQTEVSTESSEDEADVEEQESPKEEALPMQAGEAVYYDGQILFRNYSSQAFNYSALWGEFPRDLIQFVPGSLCSFDPQSPEKGINTVCEDNGNGSLYLLNGEVLYSQCATKGESDYLPVSHIYKKKLPSGEQEEIGLGEIKGFSPDGNHFVSYHYTTDPYQVHYYTYETGDMDTDRAHYEPAEGAIFLTIDNDNAYFFEQTEEDNTYLVVQVSNDGAIYKLGECALSDGFEYGIPFPEFSGNVTTENGTLEAQFDFYEGTGHFYYTSVRVSVPIYTGAEKVTDDSILYEAQVDVFQSEDDPQYIYPEEIKDIKYDYANQNSGSGIGKVVQYYQELDEGIFYTIAQSHRDPFEDIGWRESFYMLNYFYYFLPKGEKDPVLLYTMFVPYGEKGDISEYESYEQQPTIYAYAGFYADETGKLVGAYYEKINVISPESPIEESNLYHMAEFADDFYYEHPREEGMLEDFVVEGPDEFSSMINSWIPQDKIPVRQAKYDEDGKLMYEPELSINEGDSVYACHLAFDKDGKIYYIRPLIID